MLKRKPCRKEMWCFEYMIQSYRKICWRYKSLSFQKWCLHKKPLLGPPGGAKSEPTLSSSWPQKGGTPSSKATTLLWLFFFCFLFFPNNLYLQRACWNIYKCNYMTFGFKRANLWGRKIGLRSWQLIGEKLGDRYSGAHYTVLFSFMFKIFN